MIDAHDRKPADRRAREYRDEADDLRREVATLRAERDEARVDIAELRRQLASRTEALQTANCTAAGLRARAEAAEAERDEVRARSDAQVDHDTSERVSLITRVDAAEARVAELESAIAKMTARCEARPDISAEDCRDVIARDFEVLAGAGTTDALQRIWHAIRKHAGEEG